MSYVTGTHSNLIDNYSTKGLQSTHQANTVGRMLNKINGTNGIKVFTDQNGITINGAGRLPFDDRLAFGIKFRIISGAIYYRGELYACPEYELTLTEPEYYIHVKLDRSNPSLVVIDVSTTGINPPTSEYVNVILYKVKQDVDAVVPSESYILQYIYNVGDIVWGGEGYDLHFGINKVDDDHIMVKGGTIYYNGVKFVIADTAPVDVSAASKYVYIKIEFDSDELPISADIFIAESLPVEVAYQQKYWILGEVNVTVGVITNIDQYWTGGDVDTLGLPTPADTDKYMVLQVAADGTGKLKWDWTRLH